MHAPGEAAVPREFEVVFSTSEIWFRLWISRFLPVGQSEGNWYSKYGTLHACQEG
jgi:hypothetical protein